ncbi:MAG TPA: helix-turn-helix domain-containing protein [Candidatus Paceibacterota bacterium]|nr:helix-turn-helix domain-containing protein [Candidatus Paceibacterota bacterium]
MGISHQKQLQSFGLSAKEALVYETLLRVGSATASQLAARTKLNRSTTYVQVRSLMNSGLATSVKRDKKTVFAAESPENLEHLLDKKMSALTEQKKNIAQLLPELAKTFVSRSTTPVVRHFQGKDGLSAMRNEVLRSTDSKIRIITDYDKISRVYSEEERKAYSNQRKQQMTKSYILYSLAEGTDFTPHVHQHLKRLDAQRSPFGCTVYIYGSTVSFAALDHEVVGVSIDQPAIAAAMKQLFDSYWDYNPHVN